MNRKIKVSFIYGISCIIIFLLFIYANDTSSKYNKDVKEIKARVTRVDDSNVVKAGVSAVGFQELEVIAINSDFKGQNIIVENQLLGKLDFDNYYELGDILIAAIKVEDNEIIDAKAVELYRQNYLLAVFLVFVILLIIYARSIGIKALLSFLCTLFVLWKFLIPNLLQGRNPLLIAFVTLFVLSAIILFTVAGFNKKGMSAFLGTISGLLITLVLTIIVGDRLGLMGMTSPYAETIVFSGYFNLNMRYIFYVAIIIGSSGAAMDIAMDVSSACQEIKAKKQEITQKELIKSGFNVGRDVIGTMTTTLLLAYSGGYLTLLMLFQIRDSSFTRIVNMKIISAEIMRTLIGSIGLIIVAPITAIIAGVLMGKKVEQ